MKCKAFNACQLLMLGTICHRLTHKKISDALARLSQGPLDLKQTLYHIVLKASLYCKENKYRALDKREYLMIIRDNFC